MASDRISSSCPDTATTTTSEANTTFSGTRRDLPTAQLVALCASYGCQLLVLSTCESARLSGPVIDDGTSFPQTSSRSRFPSGPQRQLGASRACSGVVRGQTVDDAMAVVRAIDTEDEMLSSMPCTCIVDRARSLRITDAAPPPPGPPATRCPGMELALGTLNSFAHWEEPATLLAPAGGGGEALVQHWAELVARSQSQATRWRVLLDGAPILEVAGAQLVRLAHPYSFVPVPTENLVYFDGMDRELAEQLLGPEIRTSHTSVAEHPLLGCRAS